MSKSSRITTSLSGFGFSFFIFIFLSFPIFCLCFIVCFFLTIFYHRLWKVSNVICVMCFVFLSHTRSDGKLGITFFLFLQIQFCLLVFASSLDLRKSSIKNVWENNSLALIFITFQTVEIINIHLFFLLLRIYIYVFVCQGVWSVLNSLCFSRFWLRKEEEKLASSSEICKIKNFEWQKIINKFYEESLFYNYNYAFMYILLCCFYVLH